MGTPQPTSTTVSSGRSLSTETQLVSEITLYWLKLPSMHIPPTSWPSPWKRNVPSGMQPSRIVAPRSQMFEWPVAQKRQWPQTGRKDVTTWSPSFTRETPGPIFSMIPAPSWPPTIGKRGTMSPWRRCSSEWHSPAATQRISTSPCLGSSRSSSAISQSRPVSHSMAALVFTNSSFV